MPAWPLELQGLASALLHPTWNNIFESKTNGCEVCGFKGNERFVVSKQILESFAQAARYCHFCGLITCVLRDARLKHNIDISLGGRRDIYLSGANRSNEDSKNPWKGLPFDEDVAQTAGSDECPSLLKQWMATCVSSHAECASEPTQPLPTRVLDVSYDRPKLIISEDLSQRNKDFIALGHCWGTSQPLRTLQGNIRAHLDGIDLATLPQTFQDAVAITRFLGPRYIWIDSLCIVQDDKLDWEREAAKMADVYGLAHLVLGASSAAGGTEGFLDKRANQPLLDHPMPNSSGPSSRGPLERRGWTFQERRYELLWGCGAAVDCECDWDHRPEEGGTPGEDHELMLKNSMSLHPELDRLFGGGPLPRVEAQGSGKTTSTGGLYNLKEWPASSFYADVFLGTAKVEVDGDAIATAVGSLETEEDDVPDDMDFPVWCFVLGTHKSGQTSNASVVVLGVSASHPGKFERVGFVELELGYRSAEDFFADWDVKIVTIV
ncbi:hypothetical protein C8035_v002062 [Colletotrichum spinosum]|uniref:Heterokaryon incompatibility domain-containing protein n=1 Tax=Colletotrichum spinosum TaxID=1347390 RepID=A0A4V6QEC9_9PEZI|nr:hypothetical protein C8035_v002062 [Colletotrichum spinosum]